MYNDGDHDHDGDGDSDGRRGGVKIMMTMSDGVKTTTAMPTNTKIMKTTTTNNNDNK